MTFESYCPPLGLLYIASALKQNNHKVYLIDYTAERFNEEKLLQKIKKVDAIGITLVALTVNSTSKIIRIIKEKNPNVTVLIGGPHCTLVPQRALIDTGADYCVTGEGEEVIKKIAEKLEKGKKITNLPGVYYKSKNKVKTNKESELIEDLDRLSFPARELIEKYKYGFIQGFYLPTGKFTSIMTSRGCPFRCRFCLSSKYSFKKYRIRSAENVIEEFQKISEKYATVLISDDNFLADKKRVIKIMNMIKKEKMDLEMWIEGARIDSADKDLFKVMKSSGVKLIEFGIESGNDDVLEYYRKQINRSQVEKAVKLALDTGFFTIGNFIIGAPMEKEKHIQNTIDFSKKLGLDIAFFNILKYLKGSEIWDEAAEAGKIEQDEYIVISGSKEGLSNFDYSELQEWLTSAYKQFYMRPSYYITQIGRALKRDDFRLIKAGLSMLTKNNRFILSKDTFKTKEHTFIKK